MTAARDLGVARRGTDSVFNVSYNSAFPVHLDRVREDTPIAQRAVITHQPEAWPTGQYCRNDHWSWPCDLHRWGRTVLQSAGWPEAAIIALVRRAAAGELPWARS